MSAPAKRLADIAELKPCKILQATESRAAKLNLRRQTLALALAGLVYIAIGDDFRFPWASADALSLAEIRDKPPNQRLKVNDATARSVDQPVPLGVSIQNASDPSFLKVSGLPKGTTLSVGVSAGDDEWLLYANGSKDTVIRPPPHFVGVMELTVSLIVGTDINASETRSLRFEWVAEKVAEIKLSGEPRSEAKVQDEALPAAKSRSQTIRQLSTAETDALLKRGNDLIASGDLAAARLVLQRAAEADNARAAFALAGTYNPITLGELHVHGLSPDLAIARHWYERAKELGSQDASRELQVLTIRRD